MSMLLMVAAMKAKLGNPTRKLVLIKLADNANDEGICWPSYRHVADHCEVDRKTVIRHVQWLEENKFLTKQYRKDEERGNKSNVYRVDIAGGIAHLGSQSAHPSTTESPAPSTTESPRTSNSFEPSSEPVTIMSPTGSTAPEGADSVCSLCLGYEWTHGNQCERCNGIGKEPVVSSELTTDQPKAPSDTAEPVGQTEHEAAPADKPVKKRKTKAETLLDLIRSKPELLPSINCVDDTLLLEWCQQRERMKAARTDRALSKVDRALDELRTKHRVAPDTAIEAACDKGWRGLEVEWVLNHISSTGRNMSYQSGGQDVNNTPQINQPTMFDTELTEERKAKNEEMRGRLADLMEGFKK